MTDVHYLLLATGLTWIQIMAAAELHTPTWTRAGAKLAFGNRESLPEPSAVAGRAARASRNMIENMVLFVALFVAARSAGAEPTHGAAVFFFARLAYFVAYLAGILYVRSILWGIALAGLAWMAADALHLF